MNAPGMIEVPVLAVEPDGRRHEVARLVYVLEDESRVAELEAENEKLRELISDTLMDVRDYCAKYGIDIHDPWGNANADLDRRMRELGIGVEP